MPDGDVGSGLHRLPSSFLGSDGVTEYTIGTQLGTGSSGTVFTCTDSNDESVYAVKIVKLNHMKMSMSGEEYASERAKILIEVNILRNLSHPNIVRLVDVSETETSIYVVQELIEGGELFTRITDDPHFRNENVVRYVFCQLADAVLYLHSKSVIHRDIKPENILVQSCDSTPPPPPHPVIPDCPVYPIIKIVDFGLSKEISSMQNTAMTWVGTPQYWAPEVIQARDNGTSYDGRSDVWSVGVVLYVMMCRRYPFVEGKVPGALSMQERIIKGEFTFPAAVRLSDDLRDLVRKLIVPDVNKRLSLEEAFVHPWLADFPPAKLLAERWPVGQSFPVLEMSNSNISMIESVTRSRRGSVPLISEPTSTSVSSSVVMNPTQEVVRYMFPPPVDTLTQMSPVVPNIALGGLCAHDQFQLTELAKVQREIIVCFFKIQESFKHHPTAFHLMASFSSRARELQFVSASTVSHFAITAELTEGVVDDSAAFVEAGAIEASLNCAEEIRNSVVDMMTQCRSVQDQYRVLMDDVNNLIAGSRIALSVDRRHAAAIQDRATPPPSSTASSISETNASVLAEAAASTEVAMRDDVQSAVEQLLNSSLRDLRKVDDILGKCRLFWANVEQCLVRLDHFKTTSSRLLANVHLSPALMDRYKARVAEHRTFWNNFRITCTEFAKASQIEYQKFIQ
jgi:serine/threonine protein kinase